MPIGIGLPVESKYIARRPQDNHFGPTHWKAVVSLRPSSGQLTASRRSWTRPATGADEENPCSPEADWAEGAPVKPQQMGLRKRTMLSSGLVTSPRSCRSAARAPE
jgi:hypothetical protein